MSEKNSDRIVVCAYHNVGYRCLSELLRQGARVEAVFTHEDSPAENIWFESVHELAKRNDIPCHTSDINCPENVAMLKDIQPDFLFSFYYRFMIRKEILEIPIRGALNMHGSYLPRYRGRVPVNWAIINGERETGATLHYMVEKPDAGDIVDQERVMIEFTDTAHDVFAKVTAAAERVIGRTWPLLRAGTASRTPMNLAGGSYFGGRKPEDGRIDWSKDAIGIYNLVRAVTHPYPGAFTSFEGKKVLVWSAWPVEGKAVSGEIVSARPLLVGTGDGLLQIRSMQVEGEDEITADEFAAILSLAGKRFE
jgi:methionyl-tRNA formyltransferase